MYTTIDNLTKTDLDYCKKYNFIHDYKNTECNRLMKVVNIRTYGIDAAYKLYRLQSAISHMLTNCCEYNKQIAVLNCYCKAYKKIENKAE